MRSRRATYMHQRECKQYVKIIHKLRFVSLQQLGPKIANNFMCMHVYRRTLIFRIIQFWKLTVIYVKYVVHLLCTLRCTKQFNLFCAEFRIWNYWTLTVLLVNFVIERLYVGTSKYSFYALLYYKLVGNTFSQSLPGYTSGSGNYYYYYLRSE